MLSLQPLSESKFDIFNKTKIVILMESLLYLLPLFGVVGLLYMAYQFSWVNKQDEGEGKMKIIAGHIREGAMAFLKAEYRVLAVFVVIAGIALGNSFYYC